MKRIALAAALLVPAIHAQTRKTPAPIIDGPDYLASQKQSPAQPKMPAQSCIDAMQVIGRNGEALIASPGHMYADGMDDVHYMLDKANIADSLSASAKSISENAYSAAYCKKIEDTMPRLYSAWRDKQDFMSPGRLNLVIAAVRIMAAGKAQLEAEANRNISH